MARARGGLLHTVWQQTRHRPRLASAIALGVAAYFMPPLSYSSGWTRALAAWDIGVGLYLVLAWHLMAQPASAEKLRSRAKLQDDGAAVVLGLTLTAAIASLAAIVGELVGAKTDAGLAEAPHPWLAVSTILLSWLLVHTAFALHYAHEYYVDHGEGGQPCLLFPGGSSPDYLDFLYFSFVIGCTSQTSDVSIASRSMRHLALLHGVVAFIFNTTLLALTVGAVGNNIQDLLRGAR
jgi:uncharacterized membrane protein